MISSSSEVRRADVIRHKTPGGPPNGASGMNRHRRAVRGAHAAGPSTPSEPTHAKEYEGRRQTLGER